MSILVSRSRFVELLGVALAASTAVIGMTLSSCVLSAQEKPIIVIHSFTANPGVAWPYDRKFLQTHTVAVLTAKFANDFAIVSEEPVNPSASVYVLDGEVTGWRPGNRAKRLFAAGLGAGREAADIHFWISLGSQKVVDRRDTIRASYIANSAYQGSVGQLAEPFAEKLADAIKNAKLAQNAERRNRIPEHSERTAGQRPKG